MDTSIGDHEMVSVGKGAYWNRELDQFLKISIRDSKLQLVTPTGSIELMPFSENRFRAPIEIRFEHDSSSGRRRLIQTWDGEPSARFGPIALATSPSIRLSEYVGTYVNEEIDAIWRVSLENGKLSLKRLKFKPVTLQPVLLDVFTGAPWTVRFTRGSTNQVNGFVLNSYWLRNFRFSKQIP
ncbi:MAG: hypothetical protein ACR2L2_15920 [Acidobacteriota bacterium]